MEWNIANVTKTNKLFYERITGQGQDKVSLHPDSSDYQGDDLGEQVRPWSGELRPVNTEIDLTRYISMKLAGRQLNILILQLFEPKNMVILV